MQGRSAKRLPRRWTWLLVCAATLAGGCAGEAWLERPISAEVPLEGPQNGYPTALRGPASAGATGPDGNQDSVSAVSATSPAEAPREATRASVANDAPDPRLQRQQANMPVLAVIPPQYVTHANPAATPSSQPQVANPAQPAQLLSQQPSSDVAAAAIERSPAASHSGQVEFAISNLLAGDHAQSAFHPQAPSALEPVANEVQLASGQATESKTNEPPDVDKERRELIDALETEIRRRREASGQAQGATDEELPRLEQQLRLAYLAAGRLDDAVTAVESLDEQQREAYKNLMFGLGVWLSPDEARRAPLRTAKVLTSLRDATTDLAASSKLELRNLVFCERVDYFGWYTEFPRKEFQPKQQVILYVEVQNFAADHKGPAGYETELHGSYEILDSSGQIVASRQLPLDKEICRNYRRDYFLAYRIYMPDAIAPGHYSLELTIEDLKGRGKYQGRKLGEGMIEFTIR